MIVRRFARPYAKAIMDTAGSTEKADEIRADLSRLNEVRKSSEELRDVFANPGIDADSKVAIANSIAERISISGIMTRKVIEVLVRNHRMNDLDGILDALTSYVNEATNTVVAEVSSAHELSKEEQESLRRTLEKKFAKRVEMRVKTDPALLGGFVARVGSEIFDASVAGKIERFRTSLS